MLVERVRVVGEHGQELVLDTDGLSEQGWGLASWGDGAMEGWWEPPAPRAEAVARPQSDGAYAPASLLVGARVLTVVAHHDTTTAAAERLAREQVAAVCRGRIRVVVEEAGRVCHVRGFVSEQVRMTHRSGTRSTWTLIITCPDPLRYEGPGSDDGSLSGWRVVENDVARVSGGGALFPAFDQSPREDGAATPQPTLRFTGVRSTAVSVTNSGGLPTWPVLEVDGPVRWASWALGDHLVEWDRPLSQGDRLRIDTHSGVVTVNGARARQGGLRHDDFFTLPVGESSLVLDSDVPARMRVRWLPAWM